MKSLKALLAFLFALLVNTLFIEPSCAATITVPTSVNVNTTWCRFSDNLLINESGIRRV